MRGPRETCQPTEVLAFVPLKVRFSEMPQRDECSSSTFHWLSFWDETDVLSVIIAMIKHSHVAVTLGEDLLDILTPLPRTLKYLLSSG